MRTFAPLSTSIRNATSQLASGVVYLHNVDFGIQVAFVKNLRTCVRVLFSSASVTTCPDEGDFLAESLRLSLAHPRNINFDKRGRFRL
jgi:hypothetical protein